jgi:hypothetical protein
MGNVCNGGGNVRITIAIFPTTLIALLCFISINGQTVFEHVAKIEFIDRYYRKVKVFSAGES